MHSTKYRGTKMALTARQETGEVRNQNAECMTSKPGPRTSDWQPTA